MEQKVKPRCRQKIMLPETFAIRKMREILNLDRKSAAVLVEKNPKQLEKIENGFVELSPQLIQHFIHSYDFNLESFQLLVQGKAEAVKKRLQDKKNNRACNKPQRRSYKKIISKEVKALKSLRVLRGITQYTASFLCGYSKASIGHIENGRIELSNNRILHIVKSYGFTMKDYERHLNSDSFYSDIQSECLEIIKSLSEEKLKAVYPLLSTFKN